MSDTRALTVALSIHIDLSRDGYDGMDAAEVLACLKDGYLGVCDFLSNHDPDICQLFVWRTKEEWVSEDWQP